MATLSTLDIVIIGLFFAVIILITKAASRRSKNGVEDYFLGGAGTGAVYLQRWFWWHVNAATEIVSMCAAFLMSIVMVFIVPEGSLANSVLDHSTMSLLVTVAAVSIAWIVTVLVTKPENEERLREFYKVAKPGGPGWKAVLQKAKEDGVELESGNAKWDMPKQILCVFIGIITIYGSLFAGGYFVLLKPVPGAILSVVAVASAVLLFKTASKLKLMDGEK